MKTKCNRAMFLSVFILHSLLVLTSCSEFHDKVFNNLLRLCPGQYVPTENGTRLNETSEFDGCCTDNFSDSSATNSVLNKTKYATNGQSCLFPRTDVVHGNNQLERSYFMITNPPKDGCLLTDKNAETVKDNNINHPTCYDPGLSPFRRFLPVYSKSSGFIYKNPNCASCHGQNDVDLWTTFANCQLLAGFSYELGDCDFQFVYPGDHDDIQHLECFTDYYSTCPEDTSADYNKFRALTDLTVDELTSACSMDNLPRFANVIYAKNVFCYICHFCEGGCTDFAKKCMSPNAATRSTGNGLTRILDSRLVRQLHTDHDIVCESDQDKRVCHELLCPLGQVLTFDSLEKKCQMDSTQWTAEQFTLLLLFEFDHSIDVHKNNLDTILTQTQIFWPKTWNVKELYQPFARGITMVKVDNFLYNVTQALEVNSVTHVYVKLTYRHTTVKPAVLLRELDHLLMKSSYLIIDGKRHKARQSLGKSTLWNILVDLSLGGRQKLSMPIWQLSSDVKPYNRWLYKPLKGALTRKRSYFLNKLMLCKQVQLPGENFHMITHTILDSEALTMIYYNRTGQYIYDKEFLKIPGSNGEQSFRLCVSDMHLTSNESVRLQISLKLLLLATVIVNVL